jgi:hypothetical protein
MPIRERHWKQTCLALASAWLHDLITRSVMIAPTPYRTRRGAMPLKGDAMAECTPTPLDLDAELRALQDHMGDIRFVLDVVLQRKPRRHYLSASGE